MLRPRKQLRYLAAAAVLSAALALPVTAAPAAESPAWTLADLVADLVEWSGHVFAASDGGPGMDPDGQPVTATPPAPDASSGGPASDGGEQDGGPGMDPDG